MTRDTARIDSIHDALTAGGLDLLVCSLPANVLLLSGYWPVVGTALALATRDRRVFVLAPEDERDLAAGGWADEVQTFEPGSLTDLRAAEDAVGSPLARLAGRLGPAVRRIGYEHGGTFEPASYASVHLYGGALPELVGAAFPRAELVPAGGLLARLKSVKTPDEVGHLRLACRLAGDAFVAAAGRLTAGRSEVEVAADFQSALATAGGAGLPAGRVGGFAFCMAGENSAQAHGAFARSRHRPLRAGEPVLVHCNSYADGYWTDVTRTYCLGQAHDRLRQVYEAVFAARAAALDAIRPGALASAVDGAARSVLEARGYGRAFKHPTGHGVGFAAIDHNARPRLHPRSEEALRAGMVFNVEPAVYLDGWGGVRHCDVVAVGPAGAEVLTPFHDTAAAPG